MKSSICNSTRAVGTEYKFTYDPFGRVKSIKVGSRLLSQTNYKDNRSSLISEFIYGNGNKKTYAYDNLERLVSEHINGTLALSYVYDKQSNLARKQDHISGVLTEMFYDLSGRLNSITATNGQSMNIFYDNPDNTIRVQCFFEETAPLSALLPSAHNTSVFLGRVSRR